MNILYKLSEAYEMDIHKTIKLNTVTTLITIIILLCLNHYECLDMKI